MTGRELVNAAMRLLGLIPEGGAATAPQAKDVLEALNMMLASASANKLLIPFEKTQTLAVSQARTILADRPLRIVQMFVTANGTDYPVEEIPLEEYASISTKTTRGRPAYFAWDKIFPTSGFYLYPVPDVAYMATIRRWDALTQVSDLADELDLPGEYLRALKYNLAIEIAPEYGRKVSDVIAARAAESLDLVSKLNAPPVPRMVADLPGRRSAARNWTIESY